jgi:hypothetical protein
MTDIFYLRDIEPGTTVADVMEMARQSGGCFNLYRVDWRQSFLAADGARMLCWYQAPDAESARMALRQLGSDLNAVWAGNISEAEGERPGECRRIVEFAADEVLNVAETVATVESLTKASDDAELLASIVSQDRRHLVCVLGGQDEAVLADLVAAGGFGAERSWSCQLVDPN